MASSITQTLRERSKNVARLLVKANDRVISSGTFFLLTESLGLTCYHVVENTLGCPDYSIEISFKEAERHYLPAEVVTYSESCDYAFLRVTSPCPGSPTGLLQNLALPPQGRAVAIIGHPQGQCEQIDMCSVTKDSIYPSSVHLLRDNFLNPLSSKLDPNNTRLYEGASGDPVFNEHGELVAMHSGGYMVEDLARNVGMIEYGRSAVEIIIMGAVEIEDLHCQFWELVKRNDALKSYVSYYAHAPHMKILITVLKKLLDVKITHSITVRGYPKAIPGCESKKEKKECELSPLTFRMTLSLEFPIHPEDAQCDVLINYSNYISELAFTLRRPLLPSLDCGVEKPGCYKCQLGRCKACKFMKEDTTFSSYRTEKTHNICHRIDCNSSYVVYLISCTKCRLQYVGCTKNLKQRILRHISDASKPNSTSPSMVSRHFLTDHQGDVSDFKFQGLQMVDTSSGEETRKRLMLNEEAFWIWKLKTMYPNGLNLRSGFCH